MVYDWKETNTIQIDMNYTISCRGFFIGPLDFFLFNFSFAWRSRFLYLFINIFADSGGWGFSSTSIFDPVNIYIFFLERALLLSFVDWTSFVLVFWFDDWVAFWSWFFYLYWIFLFLGDLSLTSFFGDWVNWGFIVDSCGDFKVLASWFPR